MEYLGLLVKGMENIVLTMYKLGHVHAFNTVHSSSHLPEEPGHECMVEEV